MAGILDTLGQGFGHVLTPLAMLSAARNGQNPFDVLNGNALQQQQLQNAQQQGLLQRATDLNNPAVRNLLTQQPELASTFGIPNVPSGIASPEVLSRAGLQGGTPGGQVPMFPERYTSPAETAAVSKQNYFDQLVKMAQGARGGGGGTGDGGGVGGGDFSLSGFGPSGPTIGRTPTMDVQQGEINPATQQPYKPGDVGPTGARVRRLKPTQETAQTRARQESAGKIEKQLSDVEKQVKDIGEYSPLYASTQSAIRNHPGAASIFGQDVDPNWSKLQAAAGVLTTGLMNVHVGARGSEGMMKEFADNIVQSSFQGSKALQANLKAVREYVDRVRKGEDPDTVVSDLMGGGAGAPAPAQPGQPAADVPDELKAARDRIRGLGTQTLTRAGGGPIPPGQQALVGEAGMPELVQNRGQGGVQVTPLQQQAPRRLGLGPGVSAPDYAGAPNPANPNPRQLQPAGGGFGAGTGLSDADAAAARSQRGTITLGPDGLPVFVRQ